MQASLASTTNLAMGAAEKIPSESRWTNLTSSFRKTLVRRVTCPTSSLDFTGPASLAVEPGTLDGDDGAAMGNFLQSLNGVRAFRGRRHLSDARSFWEMGVLTVVLGVADKLLFALLGGADREEVPCTMQQLLGQGESLISKVMAEMLSLLEDWTGDPLRKPWMIPDILGAPMECADFIRWARAQILLMNSALMRRYECKYGILPFLLWLLIDPEACEEQIDTMIDFLLSLSECCLGTFATALLVQFPTKPQLLSARAKGVVRTVFTKFRHASDWSERQHAEVNASKPQRSSARDFANFSRHRLLRQAAVAHRNEGGRNLDSLANLKDSLAPTLARIMPLLLPLTVSPGIEAPAPSSGPHPQPSAHLTQARHVAHEPTSRLPLIHI